MSPKLRVAITGALSGLGELLLPRLLADERVERITLLDVAQPNVNHPKVEYRHVDLTLPDADQQCRTAFTDGKISALYHLAFIWGSARSPAYAHELEVAGTLHVLNAAAATNVRRIILPSLTALYGAQRQSPSVLRESAPLHGCPPSRFISDKVEVERQVRAFREARPDVAISVLRFAPILGPSVDNPATRFLKARFVPTLLGFDPPWQAIHEDDAADALHQALHSVASGEFNVVGKGIIPLSGLVAIAGGTVLPLPGPLARGAIRLFNATGLGAVPLWLLDYIHYPWVADGTRAEAELGFAPRHDAREAAASLSRASRRS
ncbi:MAG: NAD-dependent epimerase/dehydratase family protein [Myxococcaceae bacterium]